MKKPRTFTDLINDPRVNSWSDERGQCNDGIWLYLKPGWVSTTSYTSTVHEWTVADCCRDLAEAVYDPDLYFSDYPKDGPRFYLPVGHL